MSLFLKHYIFNTNANLAYSPYKWNIVYDFYNKTLLR